MNSMSLFQTGWLHAVGVMCVLYILFGGRGAPKVAAFIILLLVAIGEFLVVGHYLPKTL